MSSERTLRHWERPHYQPGGGDPFLYYVVFGPMSAELSVPPDRYHFEGVPEEIRVMRYHRDEHAGMIDGLRQGFLWESLEQDDPELAATVGAQDEIIRIHGPVSDPNDLNYLRNVVGLVECLFDSGGVALYDPFSFSWWRAGDWHERAFDSESGSPREHVSILESEEYEGHWLHTRGMRKFGRPDLSARGYPDMLREPIIDLFNRFIEFQAFGGIIEDGQAIRVDGLPAGMTCEHRGDLEDPHFNNVHVEILLPD